ncbi:MAG: sigma-70 family RNA polymerase sigma factor [Candidatus Marinimicrobia bacterium]|nr:sigma-70 family RNA polymerase sigma factor [Candidatus Neomarinimicrobiota bacterium]
MSKRSKLISDIISEAEEWLLDSVRILVPHYEDAEDIVQDVFHQFVTGFDQIRSLESTSAWFYRAAKNRVSDFYRKRARSVEGDLSSVSDLDVENKLLLEEIIPDPDSSPEHDFDLSTLETRLEKAIESLPASQREVFIWHEIEGLSFKEIAVLTGDSQNTLLSRKRYAVLALRKQLKDLYQ